MFRARLFILFLIIFFRFLHCSSFVFQMFNSSHLVFTRQITVANNVYLSFPLTIAENHANVTWNIFIREKGFNNRQLCLSHSVHIYKLLSLFVKKGLCKKRKLPVFSFKASMDMLLYITTTKAHNNNNNRNNDGFGNTK